MSKKSSEVICWSCLERTPLGKCIHCGEITKLPTGANEEEENIKERFIIQLQNRDGSNVEFFYSDLTDIIKDHFKIIKEFLVTSPQFIVSLEDGKDIETEFNKLFEKSRSFVEGLTPILQRDTRLGQNQYVLSFTFVTPSRERSNFILRLFLIITILSIFISGILVSMKYDLIANGKEVSYSVLSYYFDPALWLNAVGFFLIVFGVLFLRKILIEKDYMSLSGYKPSFVWIFVPPFYELGTLGFLLVETHPHFSKAASIKSSFRGNFIAWVVSLMIMVLVSPLNFYDPNKAELFHQSSIVASGTYEPFLFTLIEAGYDFLFGFGTGYTESHFLHPLFIATLIPFYICGLSFLPAIQLFGGSIVQASSNRLVAYLTTFLVVIALFWVGLIWLAILIFLFQDRIGRVYVLNGASPKPRSWKLILVLTLLVAVLSFPFPL